jgi:outer membrane immunogenic protein
MLRLSLILASAATLAAAPAVAQSFTGPRVEATVGYDNVQTDAAPRDLRTIDGVRIGLAAGYDVALTGKLIAGIEGGIGFDLADTTRATIVGTTATEHYRLDNGRDIDASVRLGYIVSPRTMIYAKAGWANSAFRARLDRTAGTTTTRTDVTAHEDGLRLGAGVEHLLGEHAYAKAEYRYTSYGDGVDRHQALLGLGYRF